VAEGCLPGTPCFDDDDCDDNVYCNGAETCATGRCLGGASPDVDDGNPCTLDICDETSDGLLNLGLADGDPCLDGDGTLGICLAELCVASVCGDGFVDEATEECDDANDNDLDSCRDDCTRPRFEVSGVLGGGYCDGETIDKVALGVPTDIARAPDGSLVWTDGGRHFIRRYDPATGIVTRVAGSGVSARPTDGDDALDASLSSLEGLAIDPDTGEVVFAEREAPGRILRIANDGRVRVVAGAGSYEGVHPPAEARSVELTNPGRSRCCACSNLPTPSRGLCAWAAAAAARPIVATPRRSSSVRCARSRRRTGAASSWRTGIPPAPCATG
jgi:cysteine-rich repeat protein